MPTTKASRSARVGMIVAGLGPSLVAAVVLAATGVVREVLVRVDPVDRGVISACLVEVLADSTKIVADREAEADFADRNPVEVVARRSGATIIAITHRVRQSSHDRWW